MGYKLFLNFSYNQNNNSNSYNQNSNNYNQSNKDYSSNTGSYNSGTSQTSGVIRGNSKSKIYHCPGQRDYENMADSDYLVNFNSEEEAISAGYRKASR